MTLQPIGHAGTRLLSQICKFSCTKQLNTKRTHRPHRDQTASADITRWETIDFIFCCRLQTTNVLHREGVYCFPLLRRYSTLLIRKLIDKYKRKVGIGISTELSAGSCNDSVFEVFQLSGIGYHAHDKYDLTMH